MRRAAAPARRPAAPGILVATLLVTVGCGADAVSVQPSRALDRDIEAVCHSVSEDLPPWLDEQPRRDVYLDSGETESGDRARRADGSGGKNTTAAAWGDPAAILRCGVTEPEALQPDSSCITVDGVDWFAQEAEHGYVFTTVGRAARIEVSVPDDHHPESDLLVDLAPAINQNDEEVEPCV